MPTENIIEFLRMAALTNFPFGTTLGAIINGLGDNPGWSVQISKKDERPGLIKYGRVEFYFNREGRQKLYGVQITYSKSADEQKLFIDYKELVKDLSYEQTKNFLARNNILFQEADSEYDNKEKVIKTEGQVVFYFTEDNRLQKFGRFLKDGELS